MNKFVDITGQTFGGRTVTGLSHQNPKSRNYYWYAICNGCGRKDVVSGTNLRKKVGCRRCAGKISGRKGLNSQSRGVPVYFIRCLDYIKVGCSLDPEKRLRAMETSNPYPLELLKVDTEHDEQYWHEFLKEGHYKGEWFLANYVCEIVDLT